MQTPDVIRLEHDSHGQILRLLRLQLRVAERDLREVVADLVGGCAGHSSQAGVTALIQVAGGSIEFTQVWRTQILGLIATYPETRDWRYPGKSELIRALIARRAV